MSIRIPVELFELIEQNLGGVVYDTTDNLTDARYPLTTIQNPIFNPYSSQKNAALIYQAPVVEMGKVSLLVNFVSFDFVLSNQRNPTSGPLFRTRTSTVIRTSLADRSELLETSFIDMYQQTTNNNLANVFRSKNKLLDVFKFASFGPNANGNQTFNFIQPPPRYISLNALNAFTLFLFRTGAFYRFVNKIAYMHRGRIYEVNSPCGLCVASTTTPCPPCPSCPPTVPCPPQRPPCPPCPPQRPPCPPCPPQRPPCPAVVPCPSCPPTVPCPPQRPPCPPTVPCPPTPNPNPSPFPFPFPFPLKTQIGKVVHLSKKTIKKLVNKKK